MGLSPTSAGPMVGFIGLLLLVTPLHGASVTVEVVDKDGHPVADVAVYAMPRHGTMNLPTPQGHAVMDQVGKQFVPHVLVVQTGTPVAFPNSDTVAHHVYSFSHPNKFMLPMYKGQAHPPVTFDYSGVVTLGCNIHDQMLGYILVVDSAWFGKTDKYGKAALTLDVPEEYEIRIWSPRIRDGVELLSKAVVAPDTDASVSFQLAKKLNPPHDGAIGGVLWSEY